MLFNDDSDSKPEIWRFFKEDKLQGSLLESDFLGGKKKGEASAQRKDVMTMIVVSPWGMKQLQGDASYTNKQFRALKVAYTPSLPLKTLPQYRNY